jgi:ferredoxin--NADP+ reductase
MSASAKYTPQRLLSVQPWAPNLFSFRITRDPEFRFVPGQFARIGVDVGTEGALQIVWRAYSVVSAADAPYLEFFSIVIPGGAFTPTLARRRPGDTIYVERTNYGFLTLERFAPARDLWMLCTGTGLAPFLSILAEPATWNHYRNLIVVHSVRYPNELAYADALRAGRSSLGTASLRYVPVVTRRPAEGALRERIPALLESGALEAHVGLQLDPAQSRVLLCGHPDMISAARKLLGARGLAPSRRGNPGQLAVENYW